MTTEGFAIFLLLLVKHCIVDLCLQILVSTKSRKSRYLSALAHFHYAQHGIGAMLVSWVFLPWPIAVTMGLIDYISHWNVDFSKSRTQQYFEIKSLGGTYWVLSVIDQGLHCITYYIIVVLLT